MADKFYLKSGSIYKATNKRLQNDIEITGAEIVEAASRIQEIDTTASSDAPLHKITVTLTDEQIKNLPVTPVEIVPAPGANKILIFQFAVIHKPPFVAGYIGVSNFDGIRFYYNSGGVNDGGIFRDDSISVNDLNILLYENIEDDIVFLDRLNNEAYADYTRPRTLALNGSNINEPITLRAITETGEALTGGDPSNILTITVFYFISDL